MSEALPRFESRHKLQTAVDLTIETLSRFKDPEVKNDVSVLRSAEHLIAAAKTQRDYDSARAGLKKSVEEYLATGFGKKTVENIVQTRPSASLTAGKAWAGFVDKLSGIKHFSWADDFQKK